MKSVNNIDPEKQNQTPSRSTMEKYGVRRPEALMMQGSAGQETPPSPEKEAETAAAAAADDAGDSSRAKKKRRRPLIIVLDILIVLLIGSGLFLLIKPYYIAHKQNQIMDQLDKLAEEGDADAFKEGIWVDPNANAIDGEEMEYFGTTMTEIFATRPGELGKTIETYEVPGWVQLVPVGQLQIDSIDLRLPLLEGAGVVPLRYGAGWYEKSAEVGKPGRTTVLGHTMYYDMRFFSRVPEMEKGNRVRIVTPDHIYNYEVRETKIIWDYELEDYLIKDDIPSELMLVTCYNRPDWDQRFLVFCDLLD